MVNKLKINDEMIADAIISIFEITQLDQLVELFKVVKKYLKY